MSRETATIARARAVSASCTRESPWQEAYRRNLREALEAVEWVADETSATPSRGAPLVHAVDLRGQTIAACFRAERDQ